MSRCKRCKRFLFHVPDSGNCLNCEIMIVNEEIEKERKERQKLERRLYEEEGYCIEEYKRLQELETLRKTEENRLQNVVKMRQDIVDIENQMDPFHNNRPMVRRRRRSEM